MAKKSLASYAFLLLVVVLAIAELATVNGKNCEKLSKTSSGKCDPKKCDKTCTGSEKAIKGACHKHEGKNQCFCYFDCAKKPPKGAKPAPPDAVTPSPPKAGGSPPPPAGGGSPPPPADGGGSPPPPADGGGSPPPPS